MGSLERQWLDIPELGISTEVEVHDKGKSWRELGLSEKEGQLLTAEQCIYLANSKYASQLKMDGSSSNDDFFIKQPFERNKAKGYVAWFYSDSRDSGLGCWDYPDYSGSSLGVRFVRKISE